MALGSGHGLLFARQGHLRRTQGKCRHIQPEAALRGISAFYARGGIASEQTWHGQTTRASSPIIAHQTAFSTLGNFPREPLAWEWHDMLRGIDRAQGGPAPGAPATHFQDPASMVHGEHGHRLAR
jgi:hypothetical protein